jgi:hypothetical protein
MGRSTLKKMEEFNFIPYEYIASLYEAEIIFYTSLQKQLLLRKLVQR